MNTQEKKTQDHDSYDHMSEEEDLNTQLFAGGLHPQTTNEEVEDHFSQFGKVKDIRLMRDKITKKFRGFGFVTFEDEASTKKALNHSTPHIIKGKKIEIKVASSKKDTKKKLLDEKDRKLHVMGNFQKLDEGALKKYFTKYGKIETIKLVNETKSGNRFAFILFKKEESVTKILSENGGNHTVEGNPVECTQTYLRDQLKKKQMADAKIRKRTKAGEKKKKRKKKKNKKRRYNEDDEEEDYEYESKYERKTEPVHQRRDSTKNNPSDKSSSNHSDRISSKLSSKLSSNKINTMSTLGNDGRRKSSMSNSTSIRNRVSASHSRVFSPQNHTDGSVYSQANNQNPGHYNQQIQTQSPYPNQFNQAPNHYNPNQPRYPQQQYQGNYMPPQQYAYGGYRHQPQSRGQTQAQGYPGPQGYMPPQFYYQNQNQHQPMNMNNYGGYQQQQGGRPMRPMGTAPNMNSQYQQPFRAHNLNDSTISLIQPINQEQQPQGSFQQQDHLKHNSPQITSEAVNQNEQALNPEGLKQDNSTPNHPAIQVTEVSPQKTNNEDNKPLPGFEETRDLILETRSEKHQLNKPMSLQGTQSLKSDNLWEKKKEEERLNQLMDDDYNSDMASTYGQYQDPRSESILYTVNEEDNEYGFVKIPNKQGLSPQERALLEVEKCQDPIRPKTQLPMEKSDPHYCISRKDDFLDGFKLVNTSPSPKPSSKYSKPSKPEQKKNSWSIFGGSSSKK